MIYYARSGERELGCHISQAFLHRIIHELSLRTKSLAEDSHKWLTKDPRNRPSAVLIVLAVLYGLYARQSTLELRGYPVWFSQYAKEVSWLIIVQKTIASSLRERAEKTSRCLLRFGNATHELMDNEYKDSTSVGDFEHFSRAVLQELVIHLEDEIHTTHESNPPDQASLFSRDWIINSNMCVFNGPLKPSMD